LGFSSAVYLSNPSTFQEYSGSPQSRLRSKRGYDSIASVVPVSRPTSVHSPRSKFETMRWLSSTIFLPSASFMILDDSCSLACAAPTAYVTVVVLGLYDHPCPFLRPLTSSDIAPKPWPGPAAWPSRFLSCKRLGCGAEFPRCPFLSAGCLDPNRVAKVRQ